MLFRIASALAAAAALAACASSADNETPPPAWFAERANAGASGFPDLRDVPRDHMANTNQRYWDAATAEVVTAGQEMQAHPRAEPGPPPEDPNQFLEDAREDLDETRDSH